MSTLAHDTTFFAHPATVVQLLTNVDQSDDWYGTSGIQAAVVIAFSVQTTPSNQSVLSWHYHENRTFNKIVSINELIVIKHEYSATEKQSVGIGNTLLVQNVVKNVNSVYVLSTKCTPLKVYVSMRGVRVKLDLLNAQNNTFNTVMTDKLLYLYFSI